VEHRRKQPRDLSRQPRQPGALHHRQARQRDRAHEGWGNDYEPARRTGDWQFQHFKADKTVNMSETTARCQSCHQGREDRQHLYTFGDLQSFKK
jgi:hypothetical protein